MTQITLNIENPALLPSLKKIFASLNGVSIAATPKRKRKCGLELALEDVAAGRVHQAESVDQMFDDILGEGWRTK